ncbi:hypothetical protein [Kitasatospora sp. NPDC001175]
MAALIRGFTRSKTDRVGNFWFTWFHVKHRPSP